MTPRPRDTALVAVGPASDSSDAARTSRINNFDINLRTGQLTALITTNGEKLGQFAIFTLGMVQTIDGSSD